MSSFDRSKRRLFFLIAIIGLFIIIADLLILSGTDVRSHVGNLPILGKQQKPAGAGSSGHDRLDSSWGDDSSFDDVQGPVDLHPISKLMVEADKKWREYEDDRSMTFMETVSKYRRKYGRHPPPGFKEWYQFARRSRVHNIDDFEQIMDDLRPFWAVEPHVIRTLAAHMWEKDADGIAGIHIRDHKVVKQNNPSWRSETMVNLIERFIKNIPDMDIAMNRLDQPRVVVPWEDMQSMLATELDTRQTPSEASDEFTPEMHNYLDVNAEQDDGPREDPQWYGAHGQQYMNIAKTACPPESHARANDSTLADSEALYKDRLGGIIINYNRSSDLCTMGPEIQDQHGFLYSSSSVIATKRLVPVFGECKVNVNSDILFPANMYWKNDERYDYDAKYDLDWTRKEESMVWRGVTSGGVQLEDNWQRMHRQRLVMLLNGTEMQDKEVRILTEQPEQKGEYENFRQFKPSVFAEKYTDVGFVETWGCLPNCDFYNDVWTLKPQITLSEQFKYKFLVDVDGHSFSGRWRAFLESKSLGIKATIFREWHDSRLFAWRHFVPMDNRFDDIYSILTYFIGVGNLGQQDLAEEIKKINASGVVYIPSHDAEARRLATQGREWTQKVLRRDDIEIYMFRLLLEYARIIDDNRDRIGYSGDGSELD
ncbi:hypothetical protein MMC08_005837 [Hypocenomyce scalaris]|nr:hypothetical protein [Hypocenomyce scalaris]